jgi:S1-C subfamily serine protease
MLAAPTRKRANLVDRLLRRRQADALQAARAQALQALERERQVRAALARGHGVDFVDDHAAHRRQHASSRFRAEQHVQRFGRGHQHLRRALAHLRALGLRRVAGAHGGPDLDVGATHRGKLRADAFERRFQVEVDVVGQRLERRNVDHQGLVGQAFGRIQAAMDEIVERGQEGGQGLARTGRRRHQYVSAGADRGPGLRLRLGRPGKGLREPGGDRRVESGKGHRAIIPAAPVARPARARCVQEALPILAAMPRRYRFPRIVLLALALVAGAACQRAQPPSQAGTPVPPKDELAQVQLAAQRGESASQRELGQRYLGGDGVPQDPALAAYWWKKAAAQGDDVAQTALATLYFSGEGVEPDRGAAVRWWRQAAANGNGDAQTMLGWAYFNGVGASRDRVQGYAWTRLAADTGIERARVNLAAFSRRLLGAELARARQLAGTLRARVRARQPPGVAQGRLQKVSEGTVFLVGEDGSAVTANHVVAGCAQLRMRGRGGVASVRAADAGHDLALLHVPGHIDAVAVVADDPGALRQGDPVVVYGFPLNAWLSAGGNLTPGTVSALAGLGNDPNQIQITAPIQAGSSGSPVLNERGVVVGVVSMHLSDARLMETTGSPGQNLNFAVSGRRLNAFLRLHGAQFDTGGAWRFPRSNADIADDARRYTRLIECWK